MARKSQLNGKQQETINGIIHSKTDGRKKDHSFSLREAKGAFSLIRREKTRGRGGFCLKNPRSLQSVICTKITARLAEKGLVREPRSGRPGTGLRHYVGRDYVGEE